VSTVGAPSLYEVLGVPPTATGEEIRAAYRRAARRVHPDAGGSQRAFRQVNEAYRVLSDPARRQTYNLRLAGRSGSPGHTGPDGRCSATTPAPSTIPAPDARTRRRYFIAMAVCLLLFVLGGAVVRHYSVPAAMVMMGVAMVIPPAAAIAVNRPPRDR